MTPFRFAHRIPTVLGAYALAGGITSFLGWMLDLRRLTDWNGTGISIQPNSALAVTFAGASLLALNAGRTRLARAAGLVVALIGSATLFEWTTGIALGIDSLLLFGREWGRVGVVAPGRMGPPGSLSWTLIGCALVLASVAPTTAAYHLRRRVAVVLGLATLSLGLTSLVAYLYGADTLYTMPRLTIIALQTATFVVAVSAGVIAIIGERDPTRLLLDETSAGALARQALWVILLLPMGLGWLRVRGQDAGLFDTAFGSTLRSISEIILLSAMVWWALGVVRAREMALREADRRKDEFLATLAHELRNPLAPMLNAIAILNGSATTAAEAGWARDVIERQMHHMTRLIDDLLDVSRISRGTIDLKRTRADLAKVIRAAVETSRPVIEERTHRLEIDLPTEPIILDADVTRLAQVFANLLNNAAKYTGPGGQISIRARRVEREAVVTVADTGIGISREQLPHIFEMFAQLNHGSGDGSAGLGVGLTLVRQLLALHGGTIVAQSGGPGMGSEFIVSIPIHADQSGADVEVVSAAPTQDAKVRRMLIVDDNREAADTLATIFRTMGNDVRTAYDGAEALEVARAFEPEVALLDLGLPGLNGYEVAQEIRTRPWGRDTLMIAITGWGNDEDRRRSQAAGFDHHLVKPVAPAVLLDLIAIRNSH